MKLLLSLLLTGLLTTAAHAAGDKPVPYPAPPAGEATKKPKRVLTPEEKAEKAQRRICKVQICAIFSTGDPQGPDIDCPIVKTWREEDIEEILGQTFTWPWGRARCSTQLKLSRSMLAAAASEGATARLDTHTIHCSLDLKSDGETYDVKVDIAPEVKFSGGKAVSARMNWGTVDAPMLAYALIYPGAKLDNSLNALGGQVVKMTNEFMGKKCSEVKDELPRRASASPVPN